MSHSDTECQNSKDLKERDPVSVNFQLWSYPGEPEHTLICNL